MSFIMSAYRNADNSPELLKAENDWKMKASKQLKSGQPMHKGFVHCITCGLAKQIDVCTEIWIRTIVFFFF